MIKFRLKKKKWVNEPIRLNFFENHSNKTMWSKWIDAITFQYSKIEYVVTCQNQKTINYPKVFQTKKKTKKENGDDGA